MSTFGLRIVTVDYCLVKPNSTFDDVYSEFCERETSLVPVIRIFGITRQGKKGCLHVHGYYPYLSIPFDPERHINVVAFKKKLAEEFNKLLSSTNTNYFRTRSSKAYNYVYRIETIKGIPFYGYHSMERTFLRIYFYNPASVEKAKTLLETGKVMNTVIQTYEAHIPYILKFFIDYNLYGMNFIDVRNVQFRFMENNVYNSDKATTCEIEGDCVAADILNRESMSADGQNPGLKSMWEEEKERRRMNYLSSQITPQCSQERENNEITSKEDNYLMILKKILSLDDENSNDNLLSSSPSVNYNASDFAKMFLDCVNTKSNSDGLNEEKSQRQNYTVEEVTEVFSQLTQTRKRPENEDNELSQDNYLTNGCEYSQVLMDIIRDSKDVKSKNAESTSQVNQCSQSSNVSNKSYTAEDFVKLMIGVIKEKNSNGIEGDNAPQLNRSHLCKDFVETTIGSSNVSGINRSEEEDENKITEEMSQVFTSVNENVGVTKAHSAAQTSPLDLAASPSSTITEDYDFEEGGVHVHKHGTPGRNEVEDQEFVEFVCDCNSNECCDLCCDRRSDLCDCEGGQCTKIPQLDGSYDCKLQTSEQRSCSGSKSSAVSRYQQSPLSSITIRVPQVDGSWDVHKSDKVSRTKRRPHPSIQPLPFLSNKNSDVIENLDSNITKSTRSRDKVINGHVDERKVVNVLGYDLSLQNSLDLSFLSQIGHEKLVIKKLTSRKINKILRRSESNTFDESDRCEFYSTNLTGKKKLNYLLSLCKPLEIKLESEDNISEASDDTLIDTNEVLQLEQFKYENHCFGSKSLTEKKTDQKLTHSIDNILNNSTKDDYSDDDYVPPTPEYALQSNKENDIGSSPVPNNVVYVEDEDDATQDYWKNDSPKKAEVSPLKSTENADVRENESESELCNHGFPLNSDGNRRESQDEIFTQVSRSQTNNYEPVIYTQLKNICSQESNKSQKSVDESSRVSISDSIVSFYDMESPISSPVAGTSNCFDLSSPPAISFLPSSVSNICSTPLDRVKEIKSHQNKKKRSLSFESEKEQSNSQKRQNIAKPIVSQTNSNPSVIEGVKTSQGYDFELSSIEEGGDEIHTHQHLTTMSLEVFTSVSGDLKPNPKNDAIRAIFYGIHKDIPEGTGKSLFLGMIIVEMDETDFQSQSSFNFSSTNYFRKYLLRTGYNKDYVTETYAVDELDLYMKLVEVLKTHDPDIVVGYEIELLSWGYVLQRATALNIQISVALSRVMDEKNAGVPDEETIQMFGVRITGRVVLNLWRILTHEITLNVYSYENVHFHVLHERVPNYSHRDLNIWFDDKLNCWRTISFYLARVEGCLRMLNKLNLVEQYSELARVFGIQFYEVLSRGSQFRVESMMSRTAKAYNYIMVSPSNQQKVKMRAPEMIALTLEPESNFYTDPVVVLDFQSLYPSVIIAYNYCYSTCLGRLEHFSDDKKFPFGCCSLYTSKNVLKQHIKNIHIAPNAVAFLKPEVRRGVLPQMLTEILETRVMVKNAMKANDKKAKPSKALKKLLNARQLGLKLIANVTYGYTGANFSGRMPCVEIADAIVSKGREALENAIKLVNSTKKWGGKVIYGDTDSLFILFPGCSKEQAFKRGHEIADEVTQMNPKPMKLKFEKVYMPCVLQTKKRYVGYSYESVDQKEPTFDAKGIETVRRDTCAATSKILEKSLKILFTTFDTAEVKLYVQRQFQKILNGRISNLQDFVFAKEYRGRENYAPNACVPALQIANRLRSVDPRAEPRKHERVPYVIVYGSDDQPLIELVRQPLELVTNPSLRLNAMYYIERVIIPPLSRVFKLMKIDVLNWFKEVPRKPVYQRSRYYYCKEQGIKPKVISEYFVTRECPVCKRSVDKQFPVDNAPNDSDLCFDCQSNWQLSALAICGEIRDLEIKFGALTKICQSCNGSNDIQQKCRSIDCPQLFRVAQTNMDLATIPYYNSLLKALEIKKASLQF